MEKFRTLKSALDGGCVISNIYAKLDKKCRVDVEPRFHNSENAGFFQSFWINSNYIKRNYSNSYEKF